LISVFRTLSDKIIIVYLTINDNLFIGIPVALNL